MAVYICTDQALSRYTQTVLSCTITGLLHRLFCLLIDILVQGMTKLCKRAIAASVLSGPFGSLIAVSGFSHHLVMKR
ncbi:hypothetical protein V8C26DRAFT_398680 [Trichoderma gracile]